MCIVKKSLLGLEGDGLKCLAMRAVGLLVKLTCTVSIAKNVSPDEYGRYILVTSVVSLFVFISGLEYHAYSIRRYALDGDLRQKEVVLFKHFSVVIALILLAIPIFSVLFWFFGQAASYFMFPLLCLLAFELLLTDASRFLRADGENVKLGVIALLQTAGWLPIVYVLIRGGYYCGLASYDLIISLWAIADLIALAMAVRWLNVGRIWRGITVSMVPKILEIRVGISECWRYYLVAISNQVKLHIARLLLVAFLEPAALGAFGFYQIFSSAVDIYIQTGIISISMPTLLKTATADVGTDRGRVYVRGLMLKSFIHSLFLSILILSGIYFCGLIFKMPFRKEFYIFPLLLVGQIASSVASMAHSVLYALREDRSLFAADAWVFVASIVLGVLCIYWLGIWGACLLNVVTGLLSLFLKGRTISALYRKCSA